MTTEIKATLPSIDTIYKRMDPTWRADKSVEQVLRLETRDPRSLINPKRFDLMAKHLYARCRKQSTGIVWARKVYAGHIEALNGFFEADSSRKCGLNDFLRAFDATLDSICAHGFLDSAPHVATSRNSLIIDGAHRAVAALLCEVELPILVMDLPDHNYNFEYFAKCGLDQNCLDSMALEYLRLRENLFLALVYPAANDHEGEASSLLSEYGRVVYSRTLPMTPHGAVNLIKNLYADEPWRGSNGDDFAGARDKACWCFDGKGPLTAYLLESTAVEMHAGKEKIRDHFGVENHSIHITDDDVETREMAELLFNKNNIHFLNHALILEPAWFHKLLREYCRWLTEDGIDREQLCLDGGAVLAAYGLRETRDLDFLHIGYEDISSGRKEIGSHNSHFCHPKFSIEEIVCDPRNHFIFRGVKFASLENVAAMKNARGEEKDVADLAMIRRCQTKQKPVHPSEKWTTRIAAVMRPAALRGRLRFVALKMRFYFHTFKRRLRMMKKFSR